MRFSTFLARIYADDNFLMFIVLHFTYLQLTAHSFSTCLLFWLIAPWTTLQLIDTLCNCLFSLLGLLILLLSKIEPISLSAAVVVLAVKIFKSAVFCFCEHGGNHWYVIIGHYKFNTFATMLIIRISNQKNNY